MDFFAIGRVVEEFMEQLGALDPDWDPRLSIKLRELLKEEIDRVEFAFTGTNADGSVVLVAADTRISRLYRLDRRRLRKELERWPVFDLIEEIDIATGKRWGRMEWGMWSISIYGYENWEPARRDGFNESWRDLREGQWFDESSHATGGL